MELKSTRYDVRGEIAVIFLARPHRRNAWTGRMHSEYRFLLDKANKDRGIGAIIVSGEGDSFCVGGDSQALQGHSARGSYDSGISSDIALPGYGIDERFDATFAYHYGLNKPIIAAINGAAAGVGLALAAFADIRFAVPKAKLTTAHGKLNLPAEYGLSWVLPRIVGLGRANDLLLTSRVFLSEEAEKIGFVNQLFSSEQLLHEAEEYARELVKNISPDSLRQTRWQIYRDQHDAVARSVEKSEELLESMMKDEDFREGVRALVEKRSPRWKE